MIEKGKYKNKRKFWDKDVTRQGEKCIG